MTDDKTPTEESISQLVDEQEFAQFMIASHRAAGSPVDTTGADKTWQTLSKKMSAQQQSAQQQSAQQTLTQIKAVRTSAGQRMRRITFLGTLAAAGLIILVARQILQPDNPWRVKGEHTLSPKQVSLIVMHEKFEELWDQRAPLLNKVVIVEAVFATHAYAVTLYGKAEGAVAQGHTPLQTFAPGAKFFIEDSSESVFAYRITEADLPFRVCVLGSSTPETYADLPEKPHWPEHTTEDNRCITVRN